MKKFWRFTLDVWHPLEPVYEAIHYDLHGRLDAYYHSPPVEVDSEVEEESDEEESEEGDMDEEERLTLMMLVWMFTPEDEWDDLWERDSQWRKVAIMIMDNISELDSSSEHGSGDDPGHHPDGY